jgi:hypothetical protein
MISDTSTMLDECKKTNEEMCILLEKMQTETLLKREEFREKVKKIFEITNDGADVTEIDDLDGDEDILDINFAGSIIRDIKRSFLTKPSFGWNFFSCLFHKRWDPFHPRDREGRIYIDIEEGWISSLLDYMRYSPCNHPSFAYDDCKIFVHSSVDLWFHYFFVYFRLANSFPVKFRAFEGEPYIEGKILNINSGESNKISRAFKDHWTMVDFVIFKELMFHHDFNESKELDSFTNKNLRFRRQFFIIHVKGKGKYGLYTNNENRNDGSDSSFLLSLTSDRMGKRQVWFTTTDQRNLSLGDTSQSVNKISSIIPIKVYRDKDDSSKVALLINHDGSGIIYENDVEVSEKIDILQVYDIQPRFCARYILARNRATETVNTDNVQIKDDGTEDADGAARSVNSTVDKMLSPFFERLTAMFRAYNTQLSEENQNLRRLQLELEFIHNYFTIMWENSVFDMKTPSSSAEVKENENKEKEEEEEVTREQGDILDYDTLFKELWYSIEEKKQSSVPVIYWKVDDVVIPILRSAVERCVPNSTLEIRISGRWKEQEGEEAGRTDKDGNLIVSTSFPCHKGALIDILSSIRGNSFTCDVEAHFYCSYRSIPFIEETLDYLGITYNYICCDSRY